MSEDLRYNAFISYRHCEPDKTIAKALHRKLENYHIPKELREKLGRNVLGRVFRDEAELPVTDSLSDAILDALRQTEYLIVICSPRLKESAWCMKEIEIFTRLHGKKKILPVLIEGEPEDSFPESLFYDDIIEKDPEGNEVTVRVDKEPLAADCRGGRAAVNDSVIKLSAAMLGLNYDDLKQRHRIEKLKRRTIIAGVIICVAFIFLIQSIYFIRTIRQQKAEIEHKYADSMANTSAELLRSGDRLAALYAARSVLPDDKTEYISPDAFRALVNATHMYSREIYVPEKRIAVEHVYGMTYFSPECRSIVIDEGNTGTLIDTATGEEILRFSSDNGQYGFYHSEGMVYSSGDRTYYYDIEKREKTVLLDKEAQIFSPPSGDIVILITREGIYGFKGSQQVYFTDLPALGVELAGFNNIECYYSEDEEYCLTRMMAYVSEDYSPEWVLQTKTSSGEVVVFLPEEYDKKLFGEDDYLLDMDTNGKELYMLTGKMDGSWEKQMYCYDIAGKKITKSVSLGKEDFTDLYHIDAKLVAFTNDRVVIYNEDFEYITSFGVPSYPQEVLHVDGRPVVRNLVGELYSLDTIDAGYDITDSIFEEALQWDIGAMRWAGDRIYIKYVGKEGVVVYVKETGSAYTRYEADEDIGMIMSDPENEARAKEAFMQLDGFDAGQYMSGTVSSDGKYYVACFADGTSVIYDAADMSRVKVMYDVVKYVYCFEYLDEYDCYAITSGNLEIFDRDFGHLVTIDRIWGAESVPGTGLIISDMNGEYFRLDLKDYNETVKYADSLLEGYTPSQRLCDKYGF